ncbi:hypothetical protein H6G89_22920 [Oscillatoria sp. FACHB-1407]|uniref:hypothetical protein n=1 Tax=Oscillatoria sp. FACHB-1407 TaxID=2692847 RepID=UPI001685ABED|nr:hypothetical protein [Oscillatoria sp. FACHB-1407]MBD2463858.1 hypothetical protein [Oscillatoria sp. FACHB-1407]
MKTTVTRAKTNQQPIREIVPIYWRRLIEVGVPIDVAHILAFAIARYDIAKRLPDAAQRVLISQYSRFLCRAELWRAKLLLPVAH